MLTSPYPELPDGSTQPFSCKWDCHYCPNEPGQPRSYLHDEPAVRRANHNRFDPILQFTDRRGTFPSFLAPWPLLPSMHGRRRPERQPQRRADAAALRGLFRRALLNRRRAVTLAQNGHPVDKIELLVLGGTWSSYPQAYQEAFCRDLFYAANTFYDRAKTRKRGTIEEEQGLNEEAACKIIGLTLETRPDTITADEIRRLRRCVGVAGRVHDGCTLGSICSALHEHTHTAGWVHAWLMRLCLGCGYPSGAGMGARGCSWACSTRTTTSCERSTGGA